MNDYEREHEMTLEEIINREPLPQEGKKWEYSKKLAETILFWFNENFPDGYKIISDKYDGGSVTPNKGRIQ